MNACKLSLSGMDLGACVGSFFTGLLPDWLVPLLPYWPWALGILALGLAYRIAGVPGLAAMAGAIGYILGRRSVERHEHVDGVDAAPVVKPKPKKRQRTIFDMLKR